MKRLLFLLLSTLAATFGFAQGTLVTISGDTLQGKILENYDINTNKLAVIDANGQATVLEPAEINSYWLEGRRFETFSNKGKVIPKEDFFQCHVKGEVSLYSKFKPELGFERFYVRVGDGDLMELKDKTSLESEIQSRMEGDEEAQENFDVILREAFAGCPDMLEKASAVALEKEKLIKAFKKYFRCTDRSYQVYKPKKDRSNWPDIGLIGGVNKYLLNEEQQNDRLTSQFGYDVGGYVNFYFNTWLNTFALQVNVLYSKYQVEQETSIFVPQYDLELEYWHFPTMILNYYDSGKLDFYAGGGVDFAVGTDFFKGILATGGMEYDFGPVKLNTFLRFRFFRGRSYHLGMGVAF